MWNIESLWIRSSSTAVNLLYEIIQITYTVIWVITPSLPKKRNLRYNLQLMHINIQIDQWKIISLLYRNFFFSQSPSFQTTRNAILWNFFPVARKRQRLLLLYLKQWSFCVISRESKSTPQPNSGYWSLLVHISSCSYQLI